MLTHPAVEEILTNEVTLAEVREYASQLAIKRRLAVDMVMLAVATLPVTTVARSEYSPCIAEARKRIGRRDPDDVELLALAMQRGIPVWSNDGLAAGGVGEKVSRRIEHRPGDAGRIRRRYSVSPWAKTACNQRLSAIL